MILLLLVISTLLPHYPTPVTKQMTLTIKDSSSNGQEECRFLQVEVLAEARNDHQLVHEAHCRTQKFESMNGHIVKFAKEKISSLVNSPGHLNSKSNK